MLEEIDKIPEITETMNEIRAEFEFLKKQTFELSKIISEDGDKKKKQAKEKRNSKIKNESSPNTTARRQKKSKTQKLQTEEMPDYLNVIRKKPDYTTPFMKLSDLPVKINFRDIQTSTTHIMEERGKQILMDIQKFQGESWDNEIVILVLPEPHKSYAKTKHLNVVVINKVFKTTLGMLTINHFDLYVMKDYGIISKYAVIISNQHVNSDFEKHLILNQIVKAETAELKLEDDNDENDLTPTIAELIKRINEDESTCKDFDDLFDICSRLPVRMILRPDLVTDSPYMIMDFFLFHQYYIGSINLSEGAYLRQVKRNTDLINDTCFIYDVCELVLPKILIKLIKGFAHMTRTMWLYDSFGEFIFGVYKTVF